MKKAMLCLVLVLGVMLTVAQSSEALSYADYTSSEYPNGNYVEFWPSWYFDGYNHVVITYDYTGGAYAVVLDPSGWPSDSYYEVYLSTNGYLYCSTDGYNWFSCY